MTGSRRLTANRNNARKSTGPRTAGGLVRSRSNALRHGFAARAMPGSRNDIETLTKALAGHSRSPLAHHYASHVAKAELARREINAQRFKLLQAMCAVTAEQELVGQRQQIAQSLLELRGQFGRLERYGRRARCRLRDAVAEHTLVFCR
jgi:hypothetical protein